MVMYENADYPRSPWPAAPATLQTPSTLHECLAFILSPKAVDEFIKQNPHCINEKGFNGQSPLHKACMTSSLEIVEIMLRHGADANARNNFDETPLHFACKRGNPATVHLLLQHGADITATDRAGKGAILHSAHGGATYNFCYLTEVQGLSTDVVDKDLQSPLHIVCEHGHVDASMYLLRKERSDVHQRDALGNTALHLAAKGGQGQLCWTLMETGGYRALAELNNEGYTPLDLARHGTHIRHQHTARLLASYFKPYYKTQRITGPTWVWYWHCVAPAVLYILALILTSLVGMYVQSKGYIMMLGMAAIIYITLQQSHRIKHICRWPNPMYAGMFAAGLFHTSVCFYAEVLPSVYADHSILTVISVCLCAIMYYMYYNLMISDPGRLMQPRVKEHTGDFYTIGDVAAQRLTLGSYCPACEIVTMPRTKHCKLCSKCFVNMDHHCLFLYKCIAGNNHRNFIRFILLVLIAMLVFQYMAYCYLMVLYGDIEDSWVLWRSVFHQCPWVWSAMLANTGSILWGICLLRFQLVILSRGHTSYFQATVTKSQLNVIQRLRNTVNFLLGKKLYAIETTDGIQLL